MNLRDLVSSTKMYSKLKLLTEITLTINMLLKTKKTRSPMTSQTVSMNLKTEQTRLDR